MMAPGAPMTTKAMRQPSTVVQSMPENRNPRPMESIHAPKSAPWIDAIVPPNSWARTPPSVTPME